MQIEDLDEILEQLPKTIEKTEKRQRKKENQKIIDEAIYPKAKTDREKLYPSETAKEYDSSWEKELPQAEEEPSSKKSYIKGVNVPKQLGEVKAPKLPTNLSPEQLEHAMQVLQTLLQATKEKVKDTKKKEKPKQVIPEEPLVVSHKSFYMLGDLGTITHPLRSNAEEKVEIPIASPLFLNAVDELRAAGFPWFSTNDNGLELFLLKAALAVRIVLHHSVLRKLDDNGRESEFPWEGIGSYEDLREVIGRREFKYKNKIEEFTMSYPDPERQKEIYKERMTKIIEKLKQIWGSNVLAPAKIQSGEKPKVGEKVCPPKISPGILEGIQIGEDFLEQWTVASEVPIITRDDTGRVIQAYECRPPEERNFDWIPPQYKKPIEDKFNLQQFRFVPPEDYQQFLYVLLPHYDKEKLKQLRKTGTMNSEEIMKNLGTPQYSTKVRMEKEGAVLDAEATDSDGTTHMYEVRLVPLRLIFSHNPNRPGIPPGEITGREYLLSKGVLDDPRLYPVLWVFCNIPAPSNLGTLQYPGLYKRYNLVYQVETKNGSAFFCYLDCPLQTLKHGLVRACLPDLKPSENGAACFEKIMDVIWSAMKARPLIPNLKDMTTMPEEYRNIFLDFFSRDGTLQCVDTFQNVGFVPDPYIPLSTQLEQQSKIPSLPQIDLTKLTNEEMDKYAQKVLKAASAIVSSQAP